MDNDELSSTTMDSPVGELTLVASRAGLRAVLFPGERPDRVTVGPVTNSDAAADEVLDHAMQQLREYFAGSRQEFDLPLDPHGTPFQQDVWAELQRIPYGTTITYAELADRVGRPRAHRAVGSANGANPIAIVVPCHRVVATGGGLGGYAYGTDTKRRLLDLEQGTDSLL